MKTLLRAAVAAALSIASIATASANTNPRCLFDGGISIELFPAIHSTRVCVTDRGCRVFTVELVDRTTYPNVVAARLRAADGTAIGFATGTQGSFASITINNVSIDGTCS